MAFFRKKISKPEAVQAVMGIFIDNLQMSFNAIKKQYQKKKDEDLYYTEAELKFCLELWLAVACRLSALRQGGEARTITDGIIEGNFGTPAQQPYLAMADGILLLHPHDQNLFHNSAYEIFNRSFSHLDGNCCAYPEKSASMVEVDGVELASCLRAVDNILREFKVR